MGWSGVNFRREIQLWFTVSVSQQLRTKRIAFGYFISNDVMRIIQKCN